MLTLLAMETFKSLHTQDKGVRPQQQFWCQRRCVHDTNTNCFLSAVVFYLQGSTGTGAADSTTFLPEQHDVTSTSAKRTSFQVISGVS